MPTYSYRCTECGTAFDIQQAFTDDSLTVCPQIINGKPCGGKLRKLFSAVGVSFSGSGFYRTDSRASETKARDKKESAAASTSSDSGSGSSGSGSSGSGSSETSSKPAAAPAASTSSPTKTAAPSSKE